MDKRFIVGSIVGCVIATLVTFYMDKREFQEKLDREKSIHALRTLCWNCAHNIGWSHGWHAYTGGTPDSVIACNREIYQAQEEYLDKVCASIRKYGIDKQLPYYSEALRKAESDRIQAQIWKEHGITNNATK